MKIHFNLLPESQKEHLRTQKVLRTIMEQEIYILIVFSIAFLSLFAIYFLLNAETNVMKEIERDITDKRGYNEVVEIHQKLKDVHVQLDNIDALNKKMIDWSKFFVLLSDNFPESVSVNKLSISAEKVSISAIAETREDIVDLKARMKEVKIDGKQCFQKINVPESNLAAPTDVKFDMTFNINLACL
ncbi:MAG: hypothetical protein CR972_02550 [Candidatus Moraniibacteriota bacterium]|nr:MAG: hypothetical protein CR972_02550 [Candidatus Moranbacteria bacterium]